MATLRVSRETCALAMGNQARLEGVIRQPSSNAGPTRVERTLWPSPRVLAPTPLFDACLASGLIWGAIIVSWPLVVSS